MSVAVFLLSAFTWAQNDTVYYTERSWDSETKTVVETLRPLYPGQYEIMNSTTGFHTVNSGYYVVRGNIFHASLIINGEVHIILCDSSKIYFYEQGLIRLNNTSDKLYIYDQPGDSIGQLIMNKNGNCLGIHSQGLVEFHGGYINIDATWYNPGQNYFTPVAAIGNKFEDGHGGTYRFFGGKIIARGGRGCAGIGGDTQSPGEMGTIEIYGGDIEAYGRKDADERFSCAGIGGGDHTTTGLIHIYGGKVKAVGGRNGAGIGSSENVDETDLGKNRIEIIIDGGTVKAYGDEYAAGIGGGDDIDNYKVTINGGHVEAYGGTDAAGIGGGEGGNGGTITINGGYVYAEGNDCGAGIGGGEDGDGANLTINGGTVIAKTTGTADDSYAIGSGHEKFDLFTNKGSLNIGDTMRVRIADKTLTPPYGNPCLEFQRQDFAWNCRDVLIEPCTHDAPYYEYSGTTSHDTHTMHCWQCLGTHTELHHFENGVCICGAIETPVPTGIDDGQWTKDNGQWNKVLRDGVIYIVRDGKTYNAQGARQGQ